MGKIISLLITAFFIYGCNQQKVDQPNSIIKHEVLNKIFSEYNGRFSIAIEDVNFDHPQLLDILVFKDSKEGSYPLRITGVGVIRNSDSLSLKVINGRKYELKLEGVEQLEDYDFVGFTLLSKDSLEAIVNSPEAEFLFFDKYKNEIGIPLRIDSKMLELNLKTSNGLIGSISRSQNHQPIIIDLNEIIRICSKIEFLENGISRSEFYEKYPSEGMSRDEFYTKYPDLRGHEKKYQKLNLRNRKSRKSRK